LVHEPRQLFVEAVAQQADHAANQVGQRRGLRHPTSNCCPRHQFRSMKFRGEVVQFGDVRPDDPVVTQVRQIRSCQCGNVPGRFFVGVVGKFIQALATLICNFFALTWLAALFRVVRVFRGSFCNPKSKIQNPKSKIQNRSGF